MELVQQSGVQLCESLASLANPSDITALWYKVFRLPQNINDEWIIRVIILFFLCQNKISDEIKIREIRYYLPDLIIFNLLSVFVLVQRILNYYPDYPTHRLYFGEVETPFSKLRSTFSKRRIKTGCFSAWKIESSRSYKLSTTL